MFEHRVMARSLEIAGATLTVSTTGGYSVHYDGAYIGYLHASVGDQWNAYWRRVDALDIHLGKYSQDEAVARIVHASREVMEESA